MNIKQEIVIHNRFDIHVDNIETGEHREITVYNIVLDQMYSRIMTNLNNQNAQIICYGRGTGTLSPTRTTLFNQIAAVANTEIESVLALPTSYTKRRIVLEPHVAVGETITEVGLAAGGGTVGLGTHALLKDSEGNPISITKTATDVVTIFATLFVTMGGDVEWLPNLAGNVLLRNLLGQNTSPNLNVGVKRFKQDDSIGAKSATRTNDVPNRKMKYSTDFSISEINQNIIEYVTISGVADIPLNADNINQALENVNLGVGDGIKTKFAIPTRRINESSLEVKVNGVPTFNFEIIKERGVGGLTARTSSPYTTFIASSRDSKYVAYAANSSPFLEVVKLDTLEAFYFPTVVAHPIAVALSGDGAVLAVLETATKCTIFTRGASGYSVLCALNFPTISTCRGLNLSDDGNTLMIAGDNAPFLNVFDRDDNNYTQRNLSTNPPVAVYACMAGNGRTVAIHDVSGWTRPIRILDLNGVEVTTIVNGSAPIASSGTFRGIKISEEGTVIVGMSTGVLCFKIDGGTLSQITLPPITSAIPQQYIDIHISNDGKVIVSINPSATTDAGWGFFIKNGDSYERVTPAWFSGSNIYGCTLTCDGSRFVFYNGGSQSGRRFLYFAEYPWIKFQTPVTNAHVITGSYVVDGLHKTDQFIFNAYFEVLLGEGV